MIPHTPYNIFIFIQPLISVNVVNKCILDFLDDNSGDDDGSDYDGDYDNDDNNKKGTHKGRKASTKIVTGNSLNVILCF